MDGGNCVTKAGLSVMESSPMSKPGMTNGDEATLSGFEPAGSRPFQWALKPHNRPRTEIGHLTSEVHSSLGISQLPLASFSHL